MGWIIPAIMGASAVAGMLKKGGGPSSTTNNSHKSIDNNSYAYTQPQRNQTRDTSHSWLQGMFDGTMNGSNPNANRFWNGSGAPGMGGGGGGGFGGGVAHAARAGASMMSAEKLDRIERAKVALGLDDPTYSFNMDKNQEERLLQRSAEQTNAATDDQWRQIQDQMLMGGDASSPAAMKIRAQLARDNVRNQANTLRDVRSDWFGDTRNLRNAWNDTATNVNLANTGWENQRLFGNQAAENQARQVNASNATSASIANAGNATSASMANSGNALGWASLDFDKHRFMWDASQDVLRPNAQSQVVQTQQRESSDPGFWGKVGSIAQFAGDAYSAYKGGGSSGGGGTSGALRPWRG